MLTFEISKQYKGTGISNGLDRGLLVYQDGVLLLDEGMGMGALALQSEGLNYFSSIRQVKTSMDQIEVTLIMDKMLHRTIFGIHSKPLTRFVEKVCTNMYKEHENSQGLWFRIGGWINILLQIKVVFRGVPSKGEFTLNYQIRPDTILVDLSGKLHGKVDHIFVMNELSGKLFDQGMADGQPTSPPSGWQLAEEESRLYSEDCGLAFSTNELDKPENLASKLYWGREADKAHCWAGYIYQLQTEAKEFQHFRYAVLLGEGMDT